MLFPFHPSSSGIMKFSPPFQCLAMALRIPIRSCKTGTPPLVRGSLIGLSTLRHQSSHFTTTRKGNQNKPDKRISMLSIPHQYGCPALNCNRSSDPLPPQPSPHPTPSPPLSSPCSSSLDHSPCIPALPCESTSSSRA